MASVFLTSNPTILDLEEKFNTFSSVQSKMEFLYNNFQAISIIPDEPDELLIVALFRLVRSENIPDSNLFIKRYGDRLIKSIIDSDCLFNIMLGASPNIPLQKRIYNHCREEIHALANNEKGCNLFGLMQLALLIHKIDPKDSMFAAWFIKKFENKFQKAAEAADDFNGDYRSIIADVLDNGLNRLDQMSLFEKNLSFLLKKEEMKVNASGSEFFKRERTGSAEDDVNIENRIKKLRGVSPD